MTKNMLRGRWRFFALTQIVIHLLYTYFAFGINTTRAADQWRPSDVLARFEFKNDGLPIPIPVRVNGEPHLFLMDTGCTQTIVDSEIAKSLERLSMPTRAETEGGSIDLPQFKAPRIDLGPVHCKWVAEVQSLDLAKFRNGLEKDFSGIMGMDMLRGFLIHIDFDAETILFCDPNAGADPPGVETAMTPSDAYIPCVPAGTSLRETSLFKIDTGMTATGQLAVDAFEALQQSSDLSDAGLLSHSVVGNASVVTTKQGRISNFYLSRNSYKDLVFLCGKSNCLGLSFLRRHRITLDFEKGKAYFDRGNGFGLRDRTDSLGILLDQGKVVCKAVRGSVGDSAGFNVGDKVEQINAQDVSALSRRAVVRILSTPTKKDATVTVLRDGRRIMLTIPGG